MNALDGHHIQYAWPWESYFDELLCAEWDHSRLQWSGDGVNGVMTLTRIWHEPIEDEL